jgi:hypothetical protein
MGKAEACALTAAEKHRSDFVCVNGGKPDLCKLFAFRIGAVCRKDINGGDIVGLSVFFACAFYKREVDRLQFLCYRFLLRRGKPRSISKIQSCFFVCKSSKSSVWLHVIGDSFRFMRQIDAFFVV